MNSKDSSGKIEYTARQKVIYDYNTIMAERFDDGMQQGIQKGIAERDAEFIEKWRRKGYTEEQINELLS